MVEDSLLNQQLAEAMLNTMGLDTTTANNGREAVDLVTQSDFDLVLMDCQMPLMDGYEATAAIRRLPRPGSRRLPIIAVTANAMEGDEQRCRAAGMDAFLTKPYTLAQLRDLLECWLPPLSITAQSAKRSGGEA